MLPISSPTDSEDMAKSKSGMLHVQLNRKASMYDFNAIYRRTRAV